MPTKPETPRYERESLKRNLRSRHLRMIAIGGAIGTGLFYGSSSAIQTAGPAVILVYVIAAMAIYVIMRCLGEMAVEEPVSGGWVSYSSRYIHRFAGFLNGWNVVLFLLATTAADLNALGRYIQFWLPQAPIWISGLAAVGLIMVVNLLSVRIYGETEFWLSIVKVTAIVVMILVGAALIFFGLGNGGHPTGLGNLTDHGGFFPKGISGAVLSIVMVAFAYGGTENLALAAGETRDTSLEIPKAINATIWRLLLFYVLAITVLITIFPWNSLTGNASPFVQVFAKVGIPAAASVMNLVVITAVLSAVNASVYSDTRILYNLSLQGNAPRALSTVNRQHVPGRATVFVFVTMFGGVLLNMLMPHHAFEVFASVTVFGELCTWASILISHLRFRSRRTAEGTADQITYKSPLYPYTNYLGLLFVAVVLVSIALLPSLRVSLVVSAIWVAAVFIGYQALSRRERATSAPSLAVAPEHAKD